LQLDALQDTKCCGMPVSTPALYSGGPGFHIVAPKPVNTTKAFVTAIFCSKMPRHASDWAATVSFRTISSSVFTTALIFRHFIF